MESDTQTLMRELVLAKSFLVKEDLMTLRWNLLVRDAVRKRPQLAFTAGDMANPV